MTPGQRKSILAAARLDWERTHRGIEIPSHMTVSMKPGHVYYDLIAQAARNHNKELTKNANH